jgi:hypothetical protein
VGNPKATVSGVDKDPSDPAALGRLWLGGEGVENTHNTKICCGFYQTGFPSSDKQLRSGFLLKDLGVTSLIKVEGSQVSNHKGVPNFQVAGALNGYTLLVMKV